MSMIVPSPRGRNRFAPTVTKPCRRSKGLTSHREVISSDVISLIKKSHGQSAQNTWDAPAITTVTPWIWSGGDSRCATDLSATGGTPSPKSLELIALDILLQTAYYLLKSANTALCFTSSTNALLLAWLDGYCERHKVYFLDRINLNNLPEQGQVPSVYVVTSEQVTHGETREAFLVQSQVAYKHDPHWGHEGTQFPNLDLNSLRHPFVLACCHQAKLSHMVDKANRHINGLQESRPTQVSDYHRATLHNVNRRGQSTQKAKHGGEITSGRPCTWSKVHMVRRKSISIEDESVYSKVRDRMNFLNPELECDKLRNAFTVSRMYFAEGTRSSRGNLPPVLARYIVRTGNCAKMEQDGDLRPPQEGSCSKKSQTAHERDTAKHQEKSSTLAGKKRSTGSADHPDDRDDKNGSDKNGGVSQPRSKRRAKDSGLKFACPFFKHDPERFKNTRSCMGPGWINVHRLKEHIFRSHCDPPFKCLRCHSAFKTEDELSDHQRQTVPCKICAPESQDRDGLSTINADTEKRLRSRKTNKSLTEEERWFNIYHIIFPGHSLPSSPYHSDTEDLEQLLNRSIKSRFQEHLRRRLRMALLNSTIVDNIVREAMAALTSAVHDSHDKDGKDPGLSEASPQAGQSVDEFSASAAMAIGSEAVSSSLPNESRSLPQSTDDSVLNHSTTADSCRTDCLSATSKPPSDWSSGIKGLSSLLGSDEEIHQEKASAPVSHMTSEDLVKLGTDDSKRTIVREPVLQSGPNPAQSLVHGGCHHDTGDASHKYPESRQEADQGNDPRDFSTSILDEFERLTEASERENRECDYGQELTFSCEPSMDFDIHLPSLLESLAD